MTGTGGTITPNSYSSGSKTIAITLPAFALTNPQAMRFEAIAGTSTPVAPYVSANLATFYEVCFVQKNTDTPKTTVQTSLLAITAQELDTVVPFHLCIDSASYHPIVVIINVATTNPPALSTDNFTLKIKSDTD